MSDKPDTNDDQERPERPGDSRPESRPDAGRTRPAAEKAPPKPTSAGGGRTIGGLASILALLSVGLSAYLFWLNEKAERARVDLPDFESMVSDLESRLGSEINERTQSVEQATQASVQQIDDELRQIGNQIAGLERVQSENIAVVRGRLDTLERRFDVVEGSVSALARNRADAGEGVKLTEAEFMLRLARQRLELFEDADGAMRALELALGLVRALNDPVYASVRQTIEQEIAALRAVEVPDRSAIAGRLRGLGDQVFAWPFQEVRVTTRETDNLLAPEADDPDWLAKARSVMADVITIHGPEEQVELATLSEQRVIRENIRLNLEIARLAAIRPDPTLYTSSLEAVEEKIRRNFDLEDERVTQALAIIEDAAGQAIEPDYPSLGKALRQLRNLSAAVELSEEEAQ